MRPDMGMWARIIYMSRPPSPSQVGAYFGVSGRLRAGLNAMGVRYTTLRYTSYPHRQVRATRALYQKPKVSGKVRYYYFGVYVVYNPIYALYRSEGNRGKRGRQKRKSRRARPPPFSILPNFERPESLPCQNRDSTTK